MAFNVFFKLVENPEEFQTKTTPWLCDKCHKKNEVLLKTSIDYDTLILCKKCLMECKKLITDREKELKDDKNKRDL